MPLWPVLAILLALTELPTVRCCRIDAGIAHWSASPDHTASSVVIAPIHLLSFACRILILKIPALMHCGLPHSVVKALVIVRRPRQARERPFAFPAAQQEEQQQGKADNASNHAASDRACMSARG